MANVYTLLLSGVMILLMEHFDDVACDREINKLEKKIEIRRASTTRNKITNKQYAFHHTNINKRRISVTPALEEPLRNLENEEEIEHRINRARRPMCRLFPQKNYKNPDKIFTTFKVKKIFYGFYTKIYAIRGQDNFIESDTDFSNLIAFIRCSPGWVEQVWTNDGSGERMDGKSAPRIEARDCGISTVLIRYCLKDPTIYNPTGGNKALGWLERQGAQGEEVLDDVRTHCKNAFVGLSFAAEPIRAGFGYLSSFIREKYDKMIVQENTKGVLFYYYQTAVAKENFDGQTGNIGSCECEVFQQTQTNSECQSHLANWFFCK